MLNALARDIRSIRAQEDIDVHSGAPFVEHVSLKAILTQYGPILALGPSAFIFVHPDRGCDLGKDSDYTNEFLAAAREMHTRDASAYELWRTFIFGVQAMCFLQRPETFKSIGQLMLRMISDNAPTAALDIGVMRHEVLRHDNKEEPVALCR
jgi:hypothetical protein